MVPDYRGAPRRGRTARSQNQPRSMPVKTTSGTTSTTAATAIESAGAAFADQNQRRCRVLKLLPLRSAICARLRAQAQAVGHHRDGAEGHRAAGDDRVEQAERGDRDRDDVVAERPDEVLLDRRERGPAERDGLGDLRDVAVQERDVARLDRDVGAGAHRDADVGLRERRCVVDAVADHRDGESFCLQRPDQLRACPRAARRRGTRARRRPAATLAAARSLSPVIMITRRPSACSASMARGALFFTSSAMPISAFEAAVDGGEDHRAPARLRGARARPALGGVESRCRCSSMRRRLPATMRLPSTVAMTPRAVTDSKSVAGGERVAGIDRRIDDGAAERVVAVLLGRGDERQQRAFRHEAWSGARRSPAGGLR